MRQTEQHAELCMCVCVFVHKIDNSKKQDRESQEHLSHLNHKSIQKCQSLESHGMEIESYWADKASSGLSGGLMYHTSFIDILQTEQSLNSSQVQVLSIILLKRAPEKKQVWVLYYTGVIGLCQELRALAREGVYFHRLLWKYNSFLNSCRLFKVKNRSKIKQSSKCCNTCMHMFEETSL